MSQSETAQSFDHSASVPPELEISQDVDISLETPASDLFMPPSVDRQRIVDGASYLHYSKVPPHIEEKPVVLGVDEAGRGPVLGPMVYALLYLPLDEEQALLKTEHNFLDSKVLTPSVRSNLMRRLCARGSDLHDRCGWAVNVLSARDISSNMLMPAGAYNLNAQAMDATVAMIQGVFDRGVNVQEIYIDTIGNPQTYQKKLERIFAQSKITVAKKADSLYPCVSAASVCAKVTRDAALEATWEAENVAAASSSRLEASGGAGEGWGSGYPSDARTTTWLKRNIDPVFGWGTECRFSWGTAKDMLESKGAAAAVDWPEEEDGNGLSISSYFAGRGQSEDENDQLANWFGSRVTEAVF